ncbi:MAG: hypothetical protein QXU69_06830, partial [Thermofilaceae archaeon]
MTLERLIRLASDWGSEIYVIPFSGALKVVALNEERTVAVTGFAEGRLEGPIRLFAHTLPDFEGVEVRDGKLVVRAKGEEVVLGEPTDLKWELPEADKWYN